MTNHTERPMTAEEFYASPGHESSELIAGRLRVSEPPGGLHGSIAVQLASRLTAWVEKHDLGTVMVETGYIVRRGPDTVRGPDVSFVRRERLEPANVPEAFIGFAPDLAVEILSPDDGPATVESKVADYLRGGTLLVWIVDPGRRAIEVRTPDGATESFEEAGWLDGAEVIPGFRCPVAELFPAR
jgi:Uma2 family endonuclease